MPVTNPVNNTTNAAVARLNCAFCSLCGVLDNANYGGLLGFFSSTVFNLTPLTITKVEQAFWLYWEHVQGLTHDDSKSLERQVAGVKWFLHNMRPTGMNVTVDQGGTTDHPLESDDAETFMNTYPNNTRFAYLLGPYISGLGFAGAHWLTAVKTGTGIQYIDYQMDVDAGIRQAVADATPAATTDLAAPHVTTTPRRPWGEALQGGDRVVVLAYLPF